MKRRFLAVVVIIVMALVACQPVVQRPPEAPARATGAQPGATAQPSATIVATATVSPAPPAIATPEPERSTTVAPGAQRPVDDSPVSMALRDLAVRHLAGWLHVPQQEIVVVGTVPEEMPASLARDCQLTADLAQPVDHSVKLTLEARGKRFAYYAAGDVIYLCPVPVP